MKKNTKMAPSKPLKTPIENSIIDFSFVTLFYCLYDICMKNLVQFLLQNHIFSFFFRNFAFGLKSQTAVVAKERVLITYDNRLGSLRRAECNKVINMTYLHKAGIGWEKQSRHIRRLQTSRSTYTLKREKFQDTCTALNMATVNVQGCDIPFVFSQKHLLCSDILSYNYLHHAESTDIAIYHIGVGYTVVRSAV
ncbi:hypothetical protein [Prevotella sp.]|uniref:hypothetical protein n=1 Tax=uncultured Prevotella sp. TaxID=159272 RepID=UPI00266B79A9|nr:hypothetical protein [uncultured Prevotella sp.]